MTNRWKHDPVLRALSHLPEPIGSLVETYPGVDAEETDWLDTWFTTLIKAYAADDAPAEMSLKVSSAEESEADLSPLGRPAVEKTVRILSARPNYFRGYRALSERIAFGEALLVIEGRNSSGKTSLSEAVEWIFTGSLSRRDSGRYGHPRELANCIANEFRPAEESTWVEVVLEVDGASTTLRRTLLEDYSDQKTSEPQSRIEQDGKELDSDQEAELLESLFAGLHPILMQHTLRQFVHDDPAARRRYFERLLQIDQLTGIIEKAVVGNTTLDRYRPSSGLSAVDALHALAIAVTDPPSSAKLKSCKRLSAESAESGLKSALCAVADPAISDLAEGSPAFGELRKRIEAAQLEARACVLPLLDAL